MSRAEDKIVFMVAPTTDEKPPILVFGIPKAAWDYMADGKTHTFDFTKIGIPLRVMMFGGKDHSDCMRMINETAAANKIPVLDERRRDFSI
jgi:hypothetical protein